MDFTLFMKVLKLVIKSVIQHLFSIFPNAILFKVILGCIRKLPSRISLSLLDLFPTNRKIIFQGYLGDIRLQIDTFYPMERMILRGYYEPTTLSIIEKFVQRNNVCVDIGANLGAVTFALAKKVQPDGRVFAFEPGKSLFTRLNQNIRLNPEFDKIIYPIKLGIADKNGILYWKEDERYPGNAGFLGVNEYEGEAVRVTTLDEYFRQNPIAQIHFMKIDVEGMESEVIKGGLMILEKYHPILYYETMREFEVTRQRPLFLQIENMLKELGYTFFKIVPNGQIVETRYPDLSDYTLAIPKKFRGGNCDMPGEPVQP